MVCLCIASSQVKLKMQHIPYYTDIQGGTVDKGNTSGGYNPCLKNVALETRNSLQLIVYRVPKINDILPKTQKKYLVSGLIAFVT